MKIHDTATHPFGTETPCTDECTFTLASAQPDPDAIRELVAQLDALLQEQAAYLADTEEGLRVWSRTNGEKGMHPVRAANRLRIVRERISRGGN